MTTRDPMSELRDELCVRAHCQYISDLHSEPFAGAVMRAIREVDEQSYGARVWNDVARYITHREYNAATSGECREATSSTAVTSPTRAGTATRP